MYRISSVIMKYIIRLLNLFSRNKEIEKQCVMWYSEVPNKSVTFLILFSDFFPIYTFIYLFLDVGVKYIRILQSMKQILKNTAKKAIMDVDDHI